ncbi:MAG TPA: hypothetical protein VIK62_04770 [Verrucomicrobiae bacterium]
MNAAGKSIVKKFAQFVLPVAAVVLLSTGCQTYEQQNKAIVYWHQGDLTNAVAEATKEANANANNKDAIIWRLEEATTLRAAGKYEESNTAFDQAQAKIDDYSQKAKVRVGQEAGALLSNQANLDYEGRSYDGIMLNTYRALNYLALGQVDNARPEIIRAYQRQQDAVDANKRRIQNTQDEAAKDKDKAKINQAEQNPQFQSQLQNSMTNINDIHVYADYVNPFTVYLDGLYFMVNAADASDLERAHKSLERAASFVPDNDYVKQDLATADDLVNAKPLLPTTYVIFETGCAPERDQVRIDIPIIISKVSYIGAAFPTIKPQGNYQHVLTVTANGTNYNTQIICSMDSIVTLDYKNELPVVITKTIAATITKAVAAYAANQAAQQAGGDLAGLFMQLGTAAFQMAVNIADTRTWTTLPKEFQICRFPTPADGKIQLSTPNNIQMSVVLDGVTNGSKIDLTSTNSVQASLQTGSLVNVVYVKAISGSTPLLVSQFKLK